MSIRGVKRPEIAKSLNVSYYTVWSVINGDRWGHLSK